MTITMPGSQARPRRPIAGFFGLTFLVGWGALASLIVFGDLMEPLFGAPSGTHPVFVLAVYSPEIAALYLIGRAGGLRDVRDHVRRLTLWRMPAGWWLFLLLAMPAGKYLSALLNGTAGEFPFSPWYMVLPALIPALLLGPIEELGWRGYAQPMLQRRFNPLVTSLVLGLFWGLWHLPAFLLSGTPQSAWTFGPFMIGAFALSIIMTPLFNVSGGSILIPALFHFQANFPAWPDGQPWENYVFALVAVVMVVWKRDHFFSRDGAVTDVVLRTRDIHLGDPARTAPVEDLTMARVEQNPRSVLLRLCALCGLFAPIAFVVGWAAGGLVQPDTYSLIDDAVSDLGALTADHAWVYNQIGANLTGLLVAALAFGLWRARSSGLAGKVGVIALGVVGVGVFFDGWLRLDCRGIDAECGGGGTSWNATAHQIESLITVLAMFVAVFALARAFKKSERWQDLRIPTLIAGFATVAGVLGGTMLTGMQVAGGGLASRVGLTVWFAWAALVSYRLLRIAQADERGEFHSIGWLGRRDRDTGRRLVHEIEGDG